MNNCQKINNLFQKNITDTILFKGSVYFVIYIYIYISCILAINNHNTDDSLSLHIHTHIFTHLADAFIQSDLQCIQSIYFFFGQYVFPGNRTHNLCAANAML